MATPMLARYANIFPAIVMITFVVACAFCAFADEPSRDIEIRASAQAGAIGFGTKWAVVVGIDQYLDPEIPDLKFAVADATLMYDTLVRTCGYQPNNILLLSDAQEDDTGRPLGINLRERVRTFLTFMEENDTVLFFFAGHGFLDDARQAFLAPKDCQKSRLGITGFRLAELRDMLQQCQAARKLLMLDCCHAGSARSIGEGVSSAELGAEFRSARGLITLASCKKDEFSAELESAGHGLFTYFLAKGLEGEADRDGDRFVDTDEIYRYTLTNVRETAFRRLNSRQTPTRLIGEDVDGVFALAKLSGTGAPVKVSSALTSIPPQITKPLKPLVAERLQSDEVDYQAAFQRAPFLLVEVVRDEVDIQDGAIIVPKKKKRGDRVWVHGVANDWLKFRGEKGADWWIRTDWVRFVRAATEEDLRTLVRSGSNER